jgi:predicted neuraminidase
MDLLLLVGMLRLKKFNWSSWFGLGLCGVHPLFYSILFTTTNILQKSQLLKFHRSHSSSAEIFHVSNNLELT